MTICFDDYTLYTYVFILFSVFFIVIYYKMYEHTKIQETNDTSLLHQQLNELHKKIELIKEQKAQNVQNVQDIFLSKILNPLSGTSPLYPGGSFSNPRGYDAFREFQQLGYISGPSGRYPVMGRYKYSGKSDKFEYYTIDNERGRIKIPFKNKNDNELYDNDPITITELGDFTFKKYEDQDGNRYDPNVI